MCTGPHFTGLCIDQNNSFKNRETLCFNLETLISYLFPNLNTTQNTGKKHLHHLLAFSHLIDL